MLSSQPTILYQDNADDVEPPCKRAKLELQDDIPAYNSAISAMLPEVYLYTGFKLAFDNHEIFELPCSNDNDSVDSITKTQEALS